MRLQTVNYNSIEKPGDKERCIRTIELLNKEINFFKEQLTNVIGKENMAPYYEEQVKRRKIWRGEK